MTPRLVEDKDFMDSMSGTVIEGGERTQDGFHLYLGDGRILIVIGQFDAYLGVVQKQSLQ